MATRIRDKLLIPFFATRHQLTRMRRRRVPGATILMYHRIADVTQDPHLLCVHPTNFEAHLRVLRETRSIISLAALLEHMRRGTVTNTMTVLTFDDGYEDNLRNAAPLLRAYDIPATVFVTTDPVGIRSGYTWDSDVDEPNRGIALSIDELRSLAAITGITIGAHTCSHPHLATCTEAEQRDELTRSKLQIESWINMPVDHLAYPYGGTEDFNETSIRLAQECGYLSACAGVFGRADTHTNPFMLPRFIVRNWDEAKFRKKMSIA